VPDSFLPPVVVDVIGRDSDLVSTIARDKALLRDFADTEANAKVGIDTRPLLDGLARARVELATGVTSLNALASAATMSLSQRPGVSVGSDIGTLFNRTGGTDAAAVTALGGGSGRGGGGSGLLALMLGAAGFHGGGSILSTLGWGGGFLGMAGIGTPLGLAGLGAEHAIMTGVGLTVSAAGGLLGGGLLGLGSLGVMGVGMGTDLAGIGQAAGDIKKVSQAQDQLNQAIAVYGPKSRQAAAAQTQYNLTLAGFSPVARAAVVQASQAAATFKDLFDKYTGPAEKTGAQIITSGIGVGETFLPTIGKFAAQNMGIIQGSLTGKGGLFSWLQNSSGTGGLGIFTDLENEFTKNLPTAMHMATQAFELFAKTVDTASHYSGGFVHTLDAFFTKYNNGAGLASWDAEIGRLIGDFRAWEGLVKLIAQDIYQLFHADSSHNNLFPGYVSTSQAIVQNLTQMLQKLHDWETSVSGQTSMHNLFAAHKQEVIQLLQLLPPLVEVFGRMEMAIAPSLVQALSFLVGLFNDLIRVPFLGTIIAWGAGIAILAGKFNLLKPAVEIMNNLWGRILAAPVQNLQLATTAVDDMGQAAGNATGLVDRFGRPLATAGEDAASAAEGVGGMASGLSGMLGPIGLVAGAIGVSLIPAFVGLFNHGPSAAEQTAQAIKDMNQQIAQMPTDNVLQIGNDLDQIARNLGKLNSQMDGMKTGSTAIQVTGGKMQALYGASIDLNREMTTMNGNVGTLAKTFGLSQGDVQSFASQVGINLKQSLDPTQIQLFGQAVADSGALFVTAGGQSSQWYQAVAQNAANAVKAQQNANAALAADTKESMGLQATIMGSGGLNAIIDFVNAQKGGLPQVEEIAQKYGVTIPQKYLSEMEQSMTAGGKISMQNLASGVFTNTPGVTAALNKLKDKSLGVLQTFQAGFNAAGAAAADGFASGITENQAMAIAAANNLGGNALKSMRAAINAHSPSRKAMETGADFVEGFKIGILGGLGGATGAARQLGVGVVGSLNSSGLVVPNVLLGNAAGVAGATGGSGAGGNHVEINVSPRTDADSNEIANDIKWAFGTHMAGLGN